MHTLYDLETQIPTFFHIMPAKVHDTKAMDVIPYEENSFYIFDRGYNGFKPMKWTRRFPPESGIQSDAVGYMASQLTMEKYPDKIRRVIYLDKESKKKFVFFTNTLTINPVMIAELYHNRWQIYSAIIAYYMMVIVQKKMNIERSIYEMLQIVSISLTYKTTLRDLFAKPNYNIVNELDGSTGPSLF